MNIFNSFLSDLTYHLAVDVNKDTSLIKCLNKIISFLKITNNLSAIQNANSLTLDNLIEHSSTLDLLINAVTVTTSEFTKLHLPLLVQTVDKDLYVLIPDSSGNHYLYDPIDGKEKLLTNANLIVKAHKIWQCSTLNFYSMNNYYEFIKSVTSNFSKEFLFVVVTGLLIGFFNAATAAFAGHIYSTINQISTKALLIQLVATTLVLSSLAVFSFLNNLWVKLLSTKSIVRIFPAIFSHIINLPLVITKPFCSGDLTQRLADYELALTQLLSLSMGLLLSSFALLFLVAYMAYCNWRISICYLVIGLIFLLIKLLMLRINTSYIEAQLLNRGKLTAYLSEVFLQIQKIRSSNAEAKVFKNWLNLLVNFKINIEKSVLLEVILVVFETLTPFLLLLSCYYFVYHDVENNTVLMLQLILCATQFTTIFNALSMQLLALIHYIPNLQRLKPFLHSEPVKNNSIMPAPNLQGEIIFNDVCYRPSPAEPWILKDISFKISPGQFVGIMGASGSGKSTLFRLLLGFEPITKGSITLDHENINQVDWRNVRKRIGVVLQNSNIFPGTILTNLSVHKQLTMDQAWELAEAVGLADDINNMPMKMFTYISDNAGEAISGGQKQKILLARALASNPRILLLDEATSALDESSQQEIFHHLEKLTITRIVIAHRLSTLNGADKIYELSRGRIILHEGIKAHFSH